MSQNPFNTLKQRFSRSRVALPSRIDKLIESPTGRADIVLSRGLCLFRRFDLTAVPASRRRQVLATELLRWCPFAESGQHVVWTEGRAIVWIWDQARVEQQFLGLPASSRWVPESVLRPQYTSGPVLQAAIDGFLGQVWQEGELVAEYWWAHQPSATEWQRFCRAGGMASPETSPEALSGELQDEQWGNSRSFSISDVKNVEQHLALGGVALFLFASVYVTTSSLRLILQRDALDAQIEQQAAQAEPILSARARAMNAKAESERLLGVLDAPDPRSLLRKVAERLPPGSRIVEWHYNLDRLEFTLADVTATALDVVQTYQSVEGFRDVSAAPAKAGEQLVISVVVR